VSGARTGGSGYRGTIPRDDDDLVEKIAWLMDRAIPLGGGWSIGLDPLLGLIPGLGDVLSAGISSVIIMQAHRRGIPRATLLRMVANVGIDAAFGVVPLLGDVFDWAYKANTKNLELYREAIAGARDSRQDVTFLLVLLAILGLIAAIPVIAVGWLLSRFGWF
jgi:hypothetical protein